MGSKPAAARPPQTLIVWVIRISRFVSSPTAPITAGSSGLHLPSAPAWPENILTVCIDQEVSEAGLYLFFSLLLALTQAQQ